MENRLGARKWAAFIIVGLFGQFAWTIENMYFNVFLYNTISTDPGYIAAMVGWSAAAATVTTLLMGALSDRLGRRRVFICGGYILWGASTAAFGFITPENAARLFPGANAAAAAAVMVVVLDCLMTFFGSTANDAAFNAYVTDATPPGKPGTGGECAGHSAACVHAHNLRPFRPAYQAGPLAGVFRYFRRGGHGGGASVPAARPGTIRRSGPVGTAISRTCSTACAPRC